MEIAEALGVDDLDALFAPVPECHAP